MIYEDATIEELEAENQRLGALRQEIRNQQLELTAVLDAKMHLREAELKVAALSDDQVAALTQVIEARHATLMLSAQEANNG